MTECEIKKKFIGYGTADGMCPYTYPDCLKKVELCGYYDKLQDLYMDAESVIAEWRAERGGKE